MSFINTRFEFNGQSSDDFGISLVHIETDMLKRNFGIQRTINSEKIRYRDTPIYFNTERVTYPISITIAKINPDDTVWSLEDRLAITQWLIPNDNQYHDFISEDHPDLLFSLQFTKGEFSDDYNNRGFVTLEAQMQHPYVHTLPAELDFDLSDNTTTTIIEVDNMSNVVEFYKPMIQFQLVGDTTTFKIKNLTVAGEESTFQNLTLLDAINVDSATQRIESQSGNSYLNNFNFKFPRLIYGTNRLEITGKCYLTIKTSFPIML